LTYSFLTYKATRAPKLVNSGLTLDEAVSGAVELYDRAKSTNDRELLANGECVVVMTDDDAQMAIKSGCLPQIREKKVLYQCGGY
jgi:hypothetical protein